MNGRRTDPPYEVGYGRPPASGRFRSGQSGNPGGRPRRRKRGRDRGGEPPYEAVLGQKVTVREHGVERQVSAAEAFLLHMTKRGLDGDVAAARAAMALIEQARATAEAAEEPIALRRIMIRSCTVNAALRPLRMAVKLDPYRETARMMLEPWLVEAALARLGERRLTAEEQRVVVEATYRPERVQWPEWWEVRQ